MVNPARSTSEPVIDGPLPNCKGYQQLNAASLASVQVLAVPPATSMVLLQAEGANVRYRADGINPTASVGMLIKDGNEVLYAASLESIAAIAFIGASTGAILNATYY